jgi:osmotically-inducible protein OsmY
MATAQLMEPDTRLRDAITRQWERGSEVDIAADVVKALDLYTTIPDRVQAGVRNGHVTLTGTVAWMFQKRDAEEVVRHVRGVREVMNYIAVTPSNLARDVHDSIVAVLHRNGPIDSRAITVTVSDDVATLSGTVRTWLQRESAERIAADAPGVNRVDNQIVVERLDLSSRDSLDAI